MIGHKYKSKTESRSMFTFFPDHRVSVLDTPIHPHTHTDTDIAMELLSMYNKHQFCERESYNNKKKL